MSKKNRNENVFIIGFLMIFFLVCAFIVVFPVFVVIFSDYLPEWIKNIAEGM